jgi:hypothetical protein
MGYDRNRLSPSRERQRSRSYVRPPDDPNGRDRSFPILPMRCEIHRAEKAFCGRNLGEHLFSFWRFHFNRDCCLSATNLSVISAIRLPRIGGAIMILPDNLPILCCPSCGGIMKQLRVIPRPGSPNLQVVACLSCNEVQVLEEKRAA